VSELTKEATCTARTELWEKAGSWDAQQVLKSLSKDKQATAGEMGYPHQQGEALERCHTFSC